MMPANHPGSPIRRSTSCLTRTASTTPLSSCPKLAQALIIDLWKIQREQWRWGKSVCELLVGDLWESCSVYLESSRLDYEWGKVHSHNLNLHTPHTHTLHTLHAAHTHHTHTTHTHPLWRRPQSQLLSLLLLYPRPSIAPSVDTLSPLALVSSVGGVTVSVVKWNCHTNLYRNKILGTVSLQFCCEESIW